MVEEMSPLGNSQDSRYGGVLVVTVSLPNFFARAMKEVV